MRTAGLLQWVKGGNTPSLTWAWTLNTDEKNDCQGLEVFMQHGDTRLRIGGVLHKNFFGETLDYRAFRR